MISSWKKQLLDTAPELFEDGRRKRKEDRETNENELYEQIGRLKMEVDWLKKKLTTFAKHKCKLIDPMHETISVRRQCELLDLNRSSYYFEPVGDSPENLKLMRRFDEMHLEWPFLGSRMIGKNLDIGRRRPSKGIVRAASGFTGETGSADAYSDNHGQHPNRDIDGAASRVR